MKRFVLRHHPHPNPPRSRVASTCPDTAGNTPSRRGLRRRTLPCVALLSAVFGSGCSTILAVGEQQEQIDAKAVIGGSVRTDGHAARGPLIVGIAAGGPGGYRVVDHFVAEKGGPWVIALQPGTYWVVAFEDVNGDGRYGDEPACRPEEADSITLTAGQQRTDLDLVIPESGRFLNKSFSIEEMEARGHEQQQTYSLYSISRAGEQVTLDDPRFRREVASAGMWKPYDFLLQAHPGIYFLEPYDPARIPVLFVHGIGGTPVEFRELIAALDHTRFQAWIAYYPSGARLENLARWLTQLFVRLRSKYHFERAAVVAHSMGGLVSRAFLLDDFDASGTALVRTFITISSPLGGMEWAGKGVEKSPVVVRSWYGLAPGSPFLDGLFYTDVPAYTRPRLLPRHIAWHMLFGYRGTGSSDGTVPISSQLRPEAQQEARSVRGFDETHTGILRSSATAARVHEILAELR